MKTRKPSFLISVTILFLFSMLSCESAAKPVPPSRWDSFSADSRDEALFPFGNEYLLFNNVTGKYDAYSGSYTQTIYKGEGDKADTIGWEWSQQGQAVTPFYPEIIYGWNPWWQSSSCSDLPRKWSADERVVVSFDREFQASGRHNTALDIWLCSASEPVAPGESGTNTIAELMIWIEHTETQGIPALETVTIDGEDWELYVINGMPSYIAFLSKSQNWNGSIDITPFLSYLEQEGHIPAGLYLSAIEFGNEVWSGYGYMKLSNYGIEIYN